MVESGQGLNDEKLTRMPLLDYSSFDNLINLGRHYTYRIIL
jgi:hypothetical protein